ncbi:MAG: alpha-L-fucosidase [Bryobacterales bacterium]|nr:alpha-L-fucosidase [Bryobacterales bacterium]
MKPAALLFVVLGALAAAPPAYQPNWQSLDSRPNPQWFNEAKFGIFIHWGVYAVPAFAPVGQYSEWYWNAWQRGPADKSGKPNPTWEFHRRVFGEKFPYFDFAPLFRAELFDPDHWAAVFARSGARYVVLTSKHHDGFALWPSEHADRAWNRPWNSVSAGPRRDLAGDLTAAVRSRGLRMGFYYSLYEWYNPLWLQDRPRYVSAHMHPQFKDLVTRYRPSLIFSDGEWDMPSQDWKSPELLAWLVNESPVRDEVVVNDRWGKETRHVHGGYFTTEYTAGLVGSSRPWEENRGMGHSFGYNRMETLKDYRTERELILMLIDLTSRGGNLLLDIGPTADGRIPVIMEERLIQIGEWLQVNGEAIYGTRPWSRTRQFSEGQAPELKSSRYMTRYDVTDFVDRKRPGQAVIEAFFTAKGDDLYAIVPGSPGRTLTLKELPRAPRSVTLLGRDGELKWTRSGQNLVIEMPDVAAGAARHAYAVRLSGAAAR